MSLVIAVDGPAASGKGTIAKQLAAHYGLPHLDTGLLYRAVGLAAMDAGLNLGDGAAIAALTKDLDFTAINEDRARSPQAGASASQVAAHADVRAVLLQAQRAFAANPKGAVLDGRDIGTVICPDAAVKLYVDADVEVRAQRRFKELQGRGQAVSLEVTLADLRERDARDQAREASPLRPAEDAHLLNTSQLDIRAALDAALSIVETVRTRLNAL